MTRSLTGATVLLAAAVAKKNNIKIYSIGVGNTGLVPFGKDFFGKPNMVKDTFTTRDLKILAENTGGQYFRARTSNDVSRILSLIFP